MTFILYMLKQKWMLIFLLIINALGTVYGYIWYGVQLIHTPVKFLPFVPDSPTASLFFTFVMLAFLFKKHIPLLEALAAVSLFKYGVWAVGMNLAGGIVAGTLQPTNYLLILSHGGMALEGILYAAYYRLKPWHLIVASLWVLHDVIIDYIFNMMPSYPILGNYYDLIGYLTFWLSILTIAIVYKLTLGRRRLSLPL